MHWAAHGQTAAEVIHKRADANQPLMGLKSTRPGGVIRKDDVVIAISASGNSPNVVRAVEYAQAQQATVIGFCGQPGGRLAQMADLKVIIPSDRIGQQEDGHLILNHVLAFALRARLEQEPSA